MCPEVHGLAHRVHTLARCAAVMVMAILLCGTTAAAQTAEAPDTSTPRDGAPRLSFLIATEMILHSADMFTTVHNLEVDGGSVREANPLLAPFSQRPLALVAVSSAVNALQVLTIAKLRPRHPKLAKAWALILIGTEAYAVAHNVRLAGRLQRERHN
jgi:hypothetical protein